MTPKGSVEAPPQSKIAKAFHGIPTQQNKGNTDQSSDGSILEVNGSTYIYKMDSFYLTLHPQFPGFRFEKPVFYEVSRTSFDGE